jgi:hypothetical protein
LVVVSLSIPQSASVFKPEEAEADKIFFKSGSVYRTSLSKTAGFRSRIMEIVPFL